MIIAVQFPAPPDDTHSAFLYSGARPGFQKPKDFWEIPLWQAKLAGSIPDLACAVIQPGGVLPPGAVVCYSVMEANLRAVRETVQRNPWCKHVAGGYVDRQALADLPVMWFDSLEGFVQNIGREYREETSYLPFLGERTIPRLVITEGCSYRCRFCVVPNMVNTRSLDNTLRQMAEFWPLNYSLVYVNDKTFGQGGDGEILWEVSKRYPDVGFIIQTTARDCPEPEYLDATNIRYVEIGVETVNDPILCAMRKPVRERDLWEMLEKVRHSRARLVPNIMVGLPGETEETYARTLDWLRSAADVISHVNVYAVADYGGLGLARDDADRDENQLGKSWSDPALDRAFYGAVVEFSCQQLAQ